MVRQTNMPWATHPELAVPPAGKASASLVLAAVAPNLVLKVIVPGVTLVQEYFPQACQVNARPTFHALAAIDLVVEKFDSAAVLLICVESDVFIAWGPFQPM